MPEEAPREATMLGKDRERVGPLSTPVSLSPENSTLKKGQVNQQEREHLETELGEKLRQPDTLEEVATKHLTRFEAQDAQESETDGDQAPKASASKANGCCRGDSS